MTLPAASIRPQAPPQPATERLARLLYAAIGPTGLVFGLLCLGSFMEQAYQPALPASMTAWMLVFGIPMLLGLLSQRAPLRLLHVMALAEGLIFVVLMLFWLFERAEPLPAGADIPWVITLTGVPVIAMAVATRDGVAWAYLLTVCTLSGVVRAVTSADAHPVLVGVEDALYSMLLLSMLLGLATMARRSAREVDLAAQVARSNLAGRAGRLARKRERLMINALVHDSVISTLLMAGRDGTPIEVLSRHASDTLARLDALRIAHPDKIVPGSQVTRRLEQLVGELAPDAQLTSTLTDTLTVPARAVTALLGAVGEAVRNSVAAAGAGPVRLGANGGQRRPADGSPEGPAERPGARPVARTVTVSAYRGGIRVAVHDDGVGFDPSRVPPERLGIAQSIIGRMESLSGGAAAVRSRPGAGTEVVVSWAPAPEPAPEPAPASAATRTPVADPEFALDFGLAPGSATALAQVLEQNRVHLPVRLSPPAAPGPAASTPWRRGTSRLPKPLSTAILVAFIAVHAVLAFADGEPLSGLPFEILGFLAVSAAAVWLTLLVPDPVSQRCGILILALCALAAAATSFPVPPTGSTPFAHWYLGAITMVMVVLAVRGRSDFAWYGYLLMTAIAIVWALVNGLTVFDGVNLAIRHAGTLLAGTLFAVGLKRSTQTLVQLNRERALNAAAAATAAAAISERETQLARVNNLARPTLEQLAGGARLDEALRGRARLVEATLRDAIRGRSLFVEPVISAARAARIRGVDVTLIDDSADRPPVQVQAAAVLVAAELDALSHGRLTARVLPADRPIIASIVVEAGEPRMLMVTPDGCLQQS